MPSARAGPGARPPGRRSPSGGCPFLCCSRPGEVMAVSAAPGRWAEAEGHARRAGRRGHAGPGAAGRPLAQQRGPCWPPLALAPHSLPSGSLVPSVAGGLRHPSSQHGPRSRPPSPAPFPLWKQVRDTEDSTLACEAAQRRLSWLCTSLQGQRWERCSVKP